MSDLTSTSLLQFFFFFTNKSYSLYYQALIIAISLFQLIYHEHFFFFFEMPHLLFEFSCGLIRSNNNLQGIFTRVWLEASSLTVKCNVLCFILRMVHNNCLCFSKPISKYSILRTLQVACQNIKRISAHLCYIINTNRIYCNKAITFPWLSVVHILK